VASPLARRDTPPVPDTESGASSFGTCGNCSAPLHGAFCAQCGEKKLAPTDYSVKHLAEEVLGEFTHFDTKFLRTLKVLLAKPGELSRAYFHGGRSRYTKPLTLFVIINVVFFLAQPHMRLLRFGYENYVKNLAYQSAVNRRLVATKESPQSYSVRFNANLQNQKKSLLIISVPVLALVMGIPFAGTHRRYAEHLVFSVQVYTFLLILLLLTVLVFLPVFWALRAGGPAGAPFLGVLQREATVIVITVAALTIYMYHGLQRAYNTSRLRAGITAFVLAWVVMFLLGIVYQNALFFATFWTT
jgi:Protein of unknown function (DUF3667)